MLLGGVGVGLISLHGSTGCLKIGYNFINSIIEY